MKTLHNLSKNVDIIVESKYNVYVSNEGKTKRRVSFGKNLFGVTNQQHFEEGNMKKFVTLFFTVVLVLSFGVSSAFAVQISKNGEFTITPAPEEPLATPDPRAVVVGETDVEFVENGELEDDGTVWISWNGKAYAKYGCVTADINYTNPSSSNIGVTLTVGIFDGDLITYFGTTFRPEDEVNELASKGYEALQNGIALGNAGRMITNGYFVGLTETEVAELEKEQIIEYLIQEEVFDMDKETLMALTEEDVLAWDEVSKLTLAQLGGYDFEEYYMEIGEAGVINPGYALYQVDLFTFPGKISLAKGEYEAVFVLQGYDAIKNSLSDFIIHLPIELCIEEDLPEELCEEYDITVATRIDDGKIHH